MKISKNGTLKTMRYVWVFRSITFVCDAITTRDKLLYIII